MVFLTDKFTALKEYIEKIEIIKQKKESTFKSVDENEKQAKT